MTTSSHVGIATDKAKQEYCTRFRDIQKLKKLKNSSKLSKKKKSEQFEQIKSELYSLTSDFALLKSAKQMNQMLIARNLQPHLPHKQILHYFLREEA